MQTLTLKVNDDANYKIQTVSRGSLISLSDGNYDIEIDDDNYLSLCNVWDMTQYAGATKLKLTVENG